MFRRLKWILLLATVLVADADWSRFRGPNGTGVSDDTGIPAEFGPDKNVVWKTELPDGLSSPVFGEDAIFLTGFEGDTLFTIAMDRESGRIRWRREIKRKRAGQLREPNNPASPSAVTDGRNVYSFFQDAGLVGYGPDGNELWRVPLGPFNNPMGLGASPILAEGKIIQVCDSETGSFMLAIDKETGKTVWRHDRPIALRGFSTPVLWRPEGGELQFVSAGSYSLAGYSVATGKRIWWVDALTWQLKPTPVIEGDYAYVLGWAGRADLGQQQDVPTFEETLKAFDKNADGALSQDEATAAIGDRVGNDWASFDLDLNQTMNEREWVHHRRKGKVVNSVQKIKIGGQGDMTETAVVWKYHKSLPNVPSPLLYGDVLYMVKDGGIFTALNKETGAVLKQGRLRDAMDRYFSSPVAADGKIFTASEPGVVSVLRPGAEWEVIAVSDFEDTIHATPVITDGKLYIRTKSALYCFAESASSGG